MIDRYDEWKLQCGHEDEVIVGRCEMCHGEVYEGEDTWNVEELEWVHEECFDEYARNVLGAVKRPAKREEW